MEEKTYSFLSPYFYVVFILFIVYYISGKFINYHFIFWLHNMAICGILIYTFIIVLFIWIINPIRDFRQHLKEEKQTNIENEKNI